jgi:hypothetical protein
MRRCMFAASNTLPTTSVNHSHTICRVSGPSFFRSNGYGFETGGYGFETGRFQNHISRSLNAAARQPCRSNEAARPSQIQARLKMSASRPNLPHPSASNVASLL